MPLGVHFVSAAGFVFTGTHLLYDDLRKVIQIELKDGVRQRLVHRVADDEFVVNDFGVIHSVDCSDIASHQLKPKALAIPQGTEFPHSVVSKDYVIRWSRASGLCKLAMFNREDGQLQWSDQADGPILGFSPEHVYVWSDRVVSGYARLVLVRKAVAPPYGSESILFPARSSSIPVIDFNWPHVLLLVYQRAGGVYLVVNVDLDRQSVKQFDFRLASKDIRVSEGNSLALRLSFRDKQSDKKYRMIGDARHDRLIVVADRAVYSVPPAESLTYEWPDWNWQPYRHED
jgi:hypothetical protein